MWPPLGFVGYVPVIILGFLASGISGGNSDVRRQVSDAASSDVPPEYGSDAPSYGYESLPSYETETSGFKQSTPSSFAGSTTYSVSRSIGENSSSASEILATTTSTRTRTLYLSSTVASARESESTTSEPWIESSVLGITGSASSSSVGLASTVSQLTTVIDSYLSPSASATSSSSSAGSVSGVNSTVIRQTIATVTRKVTLTVATSASTISFESSELPITAVTSSSEVRANGTTTHGYSNVTETPGASQTWHGSSHTAANGTGSPSSPRYNSTARGGFPSSWTVTSWHVPVPWSTATLVTTAHTVPNTSVAGTSPFESPGLSLSTGFRQSSLGTASSPPYPLPSNNATSLLPTASGSSWASSSVLGTAISPSSSAGSTAVTTIVVSWGVSSSNITFLPSATAPVSGRPQPTANVSYHSPWASTGTTTLRARSSSTSEVPSTGFNSSATPGFPFSTANTHLTYGGNSSTVTPTDLGSATVTRPVPPFPLSSNSSYYAPTAPATSPLGSLSTNPQTWGQSSAANGTSGSTTIQGLTSSSGRAPYPTANSSATDVRTSLFGTVISSLSSASPGPGPGANTSTPTIYPNITSSLQSDMRTSTRIVLTTWSSRATASETREYNVTWVSSSSVPYPNSTATLHETASSTEQGEKTATVTVRPTCSHDMVNSSSTAHRGISVTWTTFVDANTTVTRCTAFPRSSSRATPRSSDTTGGYPGPSTWETSVKKSRASSSEPPRSTTYYPEPTHATSAPPDLPKNPNYPWGGNSPLHRHQSVADLNEGVRQGGGLWTRWRNRMGRLLRSK